MSRSQALLPMPSSNSTHRWFSDIGCVVRDGERRNVFVGGMLIGSYAPGDRAARNAALMAVCLDPDAQFGRIATAFEVAPETLRQMRRQYETEGLAAVLARAPGGSEAKVTPKLRERLERMFEKGVSVRGAVSKLNGKLSVGSVAGVRKAWGERTGRGSTEAASHEPTKSAAQAALPSPERSDSEPPTAGHAEPSESRDALAIEGSEDESWGAKVEIASTSLSSARVVQHLGAWLLVAMLGRLGLHRRAEEIVDERTTSVALRIALDAVAIALAVGERCVEGVRRLATPSAGVLLGADHAPSASWVRRILGRFAQQLGGARLMFGMASEYLEVARREATDGPVVFYVDNHMRPYTGQAVVRKAWRMQDKRARPGATDFYVHDEAGRPVLRLNVGASDSLSAWLHPIAKLLREALGEGTPILLAFDRGGAFVEQLSELRDADFQFVTYERRPYPELAPGKFVDSLDDDDGQVGVCESRTNLGDGRGRLRRVALRMPDSHQVNLLAHSTLPADTLYRIMRGRWSQENGFKHGVERWGINQLDARTTSPYAPDTIIPNPARRRLDRALRIARAREGRARRELAKLKPDDHRRARWQRDLDEVLAEQQTLEAQRPETPTHAPLSETELADVLVRHEDEYKTALDTIRIACANVESELAALLGEHLRKPVEAKRALANLFAAPGSVAVAARSIVVTLQPAGTSNEREAFGRLLDVVNDWRLTLPADPMRRTLRFRSPD
jgi:transposase-like protein